MNINKLFRYSFFTLFFSVSAFAAGNAELMMQERNRVFLLNEEILMTLGKIEGNANVSFSGNVVRGSDGKLRIQIDDIQNITPYSSSRSMSDRTKIKYISFEEMLEEINPKKQAVEQINKTKANSLNYGGGSVNK